MAERVMFDFDSMWRESINKLEEILCSAHWSEKFNPGEEYSRLLIRLLRIGGIVITEHKFPATHGHTPELRVKARSLSHLLQKRDDGISLLHALELFTGHEPDENRVRDVKGVLFYPDMNAFVRWGGLEPERLFELFEEDGCKQVIVFPSAWASSHEGEYYTFKLEMPKTTLSTVLEKIRERQQEIIFEALRKASEKSGVIIPPPPRDIDL